MTAVLGPGRPFTGNERELLESTLELHRAELVAAVDGLSDDQARQQLVPSSPVVALTGALLVAASPG